MLARVTQQTDLWLALAVGAAAGVSIGLVFWAIGDTGLAAGVSFGFGVFILSVLAKLVQQPAQQKQAFEPDWQLVQAIVEGEGTALAITDRAGALRCANTLYQDWFQGADAPPTLIGDPTRAAKLSALAVKAWRDGAAQLKRLPRGALMLDVSVERTGHDEDFLLWRFCASSSFDLVSETQRLLSGPAGERLGDAGVMAALIGPMGHIRIASSAFAARSMGQRSPALEGKDFSSLFHRDSDGVIRFAREGASGHPLRMLVIPGDAGNPDGDVLIFLLDDDHGAAGSHAIVDHVRTMLANLPLGLALVDREGQFLFLNDAFCRAAIGSGEAPPGHASDLVIPEDKAALADAVRRCANGQPLECDIAVRLQSQPEELVPLSLISVAGLGDAAVLLSMKDSTEEARLKIQVAQATKMQAVGQLAGGVAHDFNNILTGILGHCDLMLMRHAPGDIDYDDIQQIRNNANRAASLTRQLLAFSRQQTLRPQILQLPDVVAEISNLLKRLMGEQVELVVKHGRGLGTVRADPGQLEQVIVNLAVNARDAMPNGGRLTIQTYGVTAAEVRRIGSDILPIADYTALSVSDTGTGIEPELLPKIFEPFFTTKDVGKGTGLGLSTVYGIVKQSGGFIFADSVLGEGTSFVIYLPVHIASEATQVDVVARREKATELWGSGTILLVEDEDMVRSVAERALIRHGYDVVTATNGEEGLSLLQDRQDIDLLVSDVVMPLMDGPALGRAARRLYPDLPIVFISGYAEEQLRQSIALDNVGFLPKPFSVQHLAEAVRAAIVR